MRTKTTGRRVRHLCWLLWLLLTVVLCGYLYYAVSSVAVGDKSLGSIFLPGKGTDGHHQIEMACTSCHTKPFGGSETLQDACVQCHADELKQVGDSHPRSKFTDPRNAETLEKIDARLCITCHTEHRPEMTNQMGVTLPDNLCIHCHADIGQERPSHQNMKFNTCANSGCHNYHDNKALYGSFLLKNKDKPRNLKRQRLDERDLLTFFEESENYPLQAYPLKKLLDFQADAPPQILSLSIAHSDVFTNKHTDAGVNCSACHQARDEKGKMASWVNKPTQEVCLACHQAETNGFLSGKHGMRLAVGLPALSPVMSRLPMKPSSHDKTLSCMSCHGAHQFNTKQAAVDSCLECHDDEHSKNYWDSSHAQLWKKEQSGTLPRGAGVSCASCHMPRVWHENEEELERILVEHNQNNTLRPNDKMLRPVCLQCHGLGFSLDALADSALIKSNFNGPPVEHVESIDMVVEADRIHRSKEKEKQ